MSKFLCPNLSLPLWIALSMGASSNVASAHATTTGDQLNMQRGASHSNAVPANYLKGLAKTSKTGMGVQLDYAFKSRTVDQFGLLQLTITRRGGGESATITIQLDADLQLSEGLPSSPAPFNPGTSYTLKVKPTMDGLRYLNVFLKSGAMGEALAIPVQLGNDPKLRKSGQVHTMPNGQRLISIPAQ